MYIMRQTVWYRYIEIYNPTQLHNSMHLTIVTEQHCSQRLCHCISPHTITTTMELAMIQPGCTCVLWFSLWRGWWSDWSLPWLSVASLRARSQGMDSVCWLQLYNLTRDYRGRG